MAQRNLDSQTISEITHKESEALTGQPEPVRGGPAAFAQSGAANARNAVYFFLLSFPCPLLSLSLLLPQANQRL